MNCDCPGFDRDFSGNPEAENRKNLDTERQFPPAGFLASLLFFPERFSGRFLEKFPGVKQHFGSFSVSRPPVLGRPRSFRGPQLAVKPREFPRLRWGKSLGMCHNGYRQFGRFGADGKE